MSNAGNPTDELVAKLWSRRHELTKAEWLEAAPILLGTAVALQHSNAEKDEALTYAESILTAVSSAGAGEALNRVRKALSHSSEAGK